MKISVVICTYNRSALLRDSVADLLAQDFASSEFEILVVDNNSSDDTRAVVESLAAASNVPVRYLFEARQGLSFARNAGILKAVGDVVVFTDDDIAAPANYLQEIDRVFADPAVAAAGGPIRPIWPGPVPEWLTADWHGFLTINEFAAAAETGFFKGPHEYPWGANIAFRREVFGRIGTFPTDLGRVGKCLLSNEEVGLCRKIEAAGSKIAYAAGAVIFHKIPAERLTRQWYYHRTYWQGRSNAVMNAGSETELSKGLQRYLDLLAVYRLGQSFSDFDRECIRREVTGYIQQLMLQQSGGPAAAPVSGIRQLRWLIGSLETIVASSARCALQQGPAEHQDLMNQIRQLQSERQALTGRLEELQSELARQQALVQEKEKEAQTKGDQVEALLNSLSWRVTQPLRFVYDLVGAGSLVVFLKLALNILRHPRTVIGAINRDTLKLALGYLKNGDVKGLAGGVSYFVGRTSPSTEFRPVILHGNIDPATPLTLPACAKPVVSIIIPVHNQWAFTHSCLASIIRHSGDVPYEVIVADDLSSDETCRIDDIVQNVRVVRHSSNLGFLRNCNEAARHAAGDYLLFLNNDTNVQPGWLSPLVEVMERDAAVGITGSKLVYPDGMLQEAGGIIWQDASGWNFGWRDDPEKSSYNFVKDVDYVSGASLMVRRELWEKTGGFDERYVPAYFEDTDLAFQTRSLGYRVVFQPKSVVVHFEGVSHGKDVGAGVKAYQETNKQKFLERWQEVLQRDHFTNGQHVFQARDRSRYRKTLLVIDHYVPMYDRDAGSYFMYSLLRALVALDYKVVFWPENLYAHQPYTDVLQQMGVEVILGYHDFGAYLSEFGSYFDGAILTRNHISIKFIDTVRKHIPRVIYHDPDLEFLREQRRFEQEGGSQAELKKIKEREFYLFRNCDIIGIHSPVERDIILAEMPGADVEVIPLPIQDTTPSSAPFSQRSGLLFVGGTHPPNVDALRYFIQEILPLLLVEIPDLTLTVAGAVSHHELKGLDLSHVTFTGFVDDLRPLFEKALVYIAPLRFGAGIKGKVLEAANFGVPVVTTSVGAEGIGLIDGKSVAIADNAQAFSAAVLALHRNQELWELIRDEGRNYVECNFSQRAFQAKVDDVLGKLLRTGKQKSA
ncbi:glycosyltransferase [Geomonas subterranea]|uniref:Glycosyltransferase n=1 Tax=Geomonas subterranea TaxID=2847989 RepID=A0ABX8LFS7_9BACT|nr:glycosyltransferase [Geomonas subterranea]QXE90903.1 glycosyltransferase [Geomonas subterranea]QXM11012.1 glycosyltransferase [Geomonas subterranea]